MARTPNKHGGGAQTNRNGWDVIISTTKSHYTY
jgi:hypothetical protein